jgi:Nitrile hydratase beta subunit
MTTMFPATGVAELIKTGGSCRVNADVRPRFAPGARILVRNINPVSHTRLPQYVRGKRGVIEHDHGVFVFPDSNARLQGEKPQHVYSVMFSARELWGPEAPGKDKLYIDLFDDYMDPVE